MYSSCWFKGPLEFVGLNFKNYHSKNNWATGIQQQKINKNTLNILEYSGILGPRIGHAALSWAKMKSAAWQSSSHPSPPLTTEAPLLLKHVHNLPRWFVAEELSQLLFMVPRCSWTTQGDPGDTQGTQPIRQNQGTWCRGTPPRQWTFPEDIDERPQKRVGWFGGDQNNQGWYDMYKRLFSGDDIYDMR